MCPEVQTYHNRRTAEYSIERLKQTRLSTSYTNVYATLEIPDLGEFLIVPCYQCLDCCGFREEST